MFRDRIESKVLIFCISLILLVYAYLYKKYDSEITINENMRISSFKEHSDWLANSIADQFFERYGDTRVIAHSFALQRQSPLTIQETLNAYVSLYRVYDFILFVDLKGNYIASNDLDVSRNRLEISNLKTKNFSRESWFLKAVTQGQPIINVSDIAPDAISTEVYGQKKAGIAFTTLVKDHKTEKPIGILSARSNLKWIQNTFMAVHESLAANKLTTLELSLVNKEGVELIGYRPQSQDTSSSTEVSFNLLSGLNLASAGYVPAQKLSQGESGAMIATTTPSHLDQVVGYTRINSAKFDQTLGWGVMVAAPTDDVLSYSYGARFVWRMVGLTLVSLLFLTGLALSKYLSVKRALAKHSETVKSILDHVADGIITINEQSQIETWNPAAENVFGYRDAEVMGKNVNMLMPEPFFSAHQTYVSNYLLTGRAKILGIGREVIGRKKDGSTFPMDLAVSEFKIGEHRFFTAIVRDITARKKAAEDLHSAKEAAEAASLAKSAFLANMSHEIRTPLGAILGFSELLVNPDVGPSEKINFVAAIKRNGEFLSNIIDDILDLSRVEAGKLKIEKRQTHISEILSEVISLLSPRATKNGTALTGICDKNIPELVISDPLRLKQILINIVGNAIKFTEHGSIDVEAKLLSIERDSLKIAFIIKDTGIGISKKQAVNLFQAFSQVDVSAKRKFGGAGLGLALSKRLATLLGGNIILIDSSPGEGCTFMITLEAGAISNTQAIDDSKKTPDFFLAPSRGLMLDGIRVLLVEDSIDNQILINKLLKLSGAKIDTAENGLVALEKIRQNKYDIILMDIQMPLMDGFEATAILRKEGYQKPIVALTAHALNEERQQCLNNGFDDHISKPIDFTTFVKTIAKQVRQSPMNSDSITK